MFLINLVEAEVLNSEIIKVVEIMKEDSIGEMMMMILKRKRKNNNKKAEDIIKAIKVVTEEGGINIKERKSAMMMKMKRKMDKIIRLKEKLRSLSNMQPRRRVQNGQSCSEKAHESKYGPQMDEL